MKIILSPIASVIDDTPPTVTGETITYRGQTYDLAPLPDGAEVTAETPFIGSINRINGEVQLTVQYQYSMQTAEPNQSTNINDYTFTITSGQCPCPIIRRPAQQPETIPAMEVPNVN